MMNRRGFLPSLFAAIAGLPLVRNLRMPEPTTAQTSVSVAEPPLAVRLEGLWSPSSGIAAMLASAAKEIRDYDQSVLEFMRRNYATVESREVRYPLQISSATKSDMGEEES